MVQKLLEQGVDPNICLAGIKPPLHIAVHNNELHMVELLLKNGADVNLRDPWGNTPLFEVSNSNMLNILLKFQADLQITNCFGDSVLHRFVAMGYKELVQLLLDLGIDSFQKNQGGKTAKDVAHNHIEIVQLLQRYEDFPVKSALDNY